MNWNECLEYIRLLADKVNEYPGPAYSWITAMRAEEFVIRLKSSVQEWPTPIRMQVEGHKIVFVYKNKAIAVDSDRVTFEFFAR